MGEKTRGQYASKADYDQKLLKSFIFWSVILFLRLFWEKI